MSQVLIIPGIGNSGPEHWQSRWQTHQPQCRRVEQRDWDHPVALEWQAALEQAVAESGPDTVLVAHSLGCLLVANWAAVSQHKVRAALLVAAPDPTGPAFPTEAVGFAPVAMQPLPFASIVVSSDDDPYSSPDFAKNCADAWGSQLVTVGAAGHINADSGLGDWPEGFELLQSLIRTG